MNVLIIEDEILIADALTNILKKIKSETNIIAVLKNVQESINFLKNGAIKPELIFCSIQLTDGLAFSIFKTVNINTPIIFITSYDKFIMDAFEHNGIDYLLKPITKQSIERALQKYERLQKHFSANDEVLEDILRYLSRRHKRRLLVRKGNDNIALPIKDIVLAYTKNKLVYIIDKTGKKYLIDKTMSHLEKELDSAEFFRANRQYIISIHYVKGFSIYERIKLEVELSIPDMEHLIIISQETAPVFKAWIAGG